MLNAKDNQKSITGHKKQSPLLPSTITTLLFFHAFLLSYYYHPIQCSSCSVMETKKIGGPEKNTILYFAPAEQATKLASKRIYGVHPIIRYAILLLFNLIHTPKSWKSLIFVYNEHCSSQLTDVMIQQAQLFTQQRSHKIKYNIG